MKYNIAAVHGNCWANPGIQQFHDLGNDFDVGAVDTFRRGYRNHGVGIDYRQTGGLV